MNLASGKGNDHREGEAEAAPPVPPYDGGSVPIDGGIPFGTQYVSVPNIFARLISDGKELISSSPLLRSIPFELVQQFRCFR